MEIGNGSSRVQYATTTTTHHIFWITEQSLFPPQLPFCLLLPSLAMDHILFLDIFLAIPLLLLLLLLLLLSSSRLFATTTQKGLTCYPIIGNLPQYLANRHRLLDWVTDLLLHNPTHTIFIRRFGNIRSVITANPANVEHVLRHNFDGYVKGERFTSILRDILGRGIFNSDGHLWMAQRKSASFEFTTRSLRNLVVDSVRQETLTRLLPLLENASRNHVTFDLQDALESFAFDNICKVSFNTDPFCLQPTATLQQQKASAGELHENFPSAFKQATFLSVERFRYAIPWIWKIKKLIGVGTERRLRECIATVHRFAETIIRSRREEGERMKQRGSSNHHEDLLSRLIATTGSSNSDEDGELLRDVVISFLLAGRETTSSALSWFFFLVSTRPDVEERILEELRGTRCRRGKRLERGEILGYEELQELQYLHAAVTETLRLYPPVYMNFLTCVKDDVLPDGTEVKKGWSVSYSSYAMGRMKSIWGDDCLEYRPERWLDGDGVFRPESSFKFAAFHGGPRMCLGKEMAYIQMKSIAAFVLERFEVKVVSKEKLPEHTLSLTFRMKHGLPVTVEERGRSHVMADDKFFCP